MTCDYYFKVRVPIRFGDMNAYGMVNHDVFLTYLEIAQAGYWKNIANWEGYSQGIIISKQSIEYLRPLRASDMLYIYVKAHNLNHRSVNFSFQLVVMKGEKEVLCARAECECMFYDYQAGAVRSFPDFLRDKIRAFEGLS